MTSSRLRQLGDTYENRVGLLAVLMIIGSVALGYAASTEEVCGGFSCETETDGVTFALVAGGYLVAAVVVLLPIMGLAHVMKGVAAILGKVEEASSPLESPPPADPTAGMPY